MRTILAIFLAIILAGCVNLTPKQEAIIYNLTEPQEVSYISSEEIEKLLPEFAEVEPGVYKTVPRGLVKNMHDAPWCFPGAASVLSPKDWTCMDYSMSLRDTMQNEGYAFGIAWNQEETRLFSGHMVNLFIDEDWKIILYDPQDCEFKRLPITGVKL